MRRRVFGGRGLLPCALSGLLTLFCATPLAAANSDSVSVDVLARIKERCGFAASGPAYSGATPDLESAASFSLPVGLDCNTPYALGITSQRGALTNIDASNDGSGYAFAKAYRVSVALDTDKGVVRSSLCQSTDLVNGGSCAFASLVPGKGLKSGTGISVDRMATLTIDWPKQADNQPRLAAGHYNDTLILVIGPRA